MTQKASTIREAAKTARSAERFRHEVLLERIRQAGDTERARIHARTALQLRAMTVTAALLGALLGGSSLAAHPPGVGSPASAPSSVAPTSDDVAQTDPAPIAQR
ncbi:hypothetical protein [Leifsonia sp. TF02-11]|uniref:hypothetical protein n=1 Tax=Leifsonia sp. TF02-11 TaxID=2815212 RepID=UPI001AA0E9F0|nr:hypothetical protein [Leifsonia sp. TF02-11]MBO1741611.1 hypothetical protein [Leifsonia sp. TF02-11]